MITIDYTRPTIRIEPGPHFRIIPLANGADGQDGAPGVPGEGVPVGGDPDDVLTKSGADDYETEWRPPAASNFLGLTDTPADYTAQAQKFTRVNGTEDGLEFTDPPLSPIGGIELSYKWSATTTAADPGSGQVRANDATHPNATELYISSTTFLGNDAAFIWIGFQPGDYLGIYETGGNNESIYYQVLTVTDNTGWVTLGVAAIPGTLGGMDNNQPVSLFKILDPNNRLPKGGDAGEVLTKSSATDFDTEWAPVEHPAHAFYNAGNIGVNFNPDFANGFNQTALAVQAVEIGLVVGNDGDTGNLEIYTGGNLVTFDDRYKFDGGSAPDVSTATEILLSVIITPTAVRAALMSDA